MKKFDQQRIFCLTTGVVLFSLGVFGFAFRLNFNLADKYLFLCLIFGVWGVVTGFSKK